MSEWIAQLRQLCRSSCIRLLEEEAARQRAEITRQREEIDGLRAENRALINSLLGTAGVPPIETSATQPNVMPVRRRSWPQISAAREAEAARQGRARAGQP
jgi:hypothetical protein